MTVFEIYSAPVEYKYKAHFFTLSTYVVSILLKIVLVTPLYFLFYAGGFHYKNRVYVVTPEISFNNKYLLIAEDSSYQPIICSTFSSYKENPIEDNCTVIKASEVNVDGDNLKDVLRFEAHLFAPSPIQSFSLILFYFCSIKELVNAEFEVMTVYNFQATKGVQKLKFFADMKLRQNEMFHWSELLDFYNDTIELGESSISELIESTYNKKFSAELSNIRATWSSDFASDSEVVLHGEIRYLEQLINYRPGFWEEIKWLWIQYIAVMLVFRYFIDALLRYVFAKGYLKSYVVKPWEHV